MDSYLSDPRIPEGLREALGKNGKALQRFCAMTEEQQRRFILRCSRSDGSAIEDSVNALVGIETGHGPYQR